MRVGLDPVAHRFLGRLVLPHLAVTEEESFVAGQAVDHGCFFTVERHLVGRVRNGQAREITDVFSLSELTVDGEIVKDLEARELVDQTLRPLRELFPVLIGPPILDVAVGSYLLPWSSKAWPISWPMTTPMAP